MLESKEIVTTHVDAVARVTEDEKNRGGGDRGGGDVAPPSLQHLAVGMEVELVSTRFEKMNGRTGTLVTFKGGRGWIVVHMSSHKEVSVRGANVREVGTASSGSSDSESEDDDDEDESGEEEDDDEDEDEDDDEDEDEEDDEDEDEEGEEDNAPARGVKKRAARSRKRAPRVAVETRRTDARRTSGPFYVSLYRMTESLTNLMIIV